MEANKIEAPKPWTKRDIELRIVRRVKDRVVEYGTQGGIKSGVLESDQ